MAPGSSSLQNPNAAQNPSPILRPVTPDDDAALRRLYAQSLERNPEGFIQNPTHHGDIAERARQWQSENGEMLGLFTPEDALIGMGGLKQKDGSRAELCTLHLNTRYQGQGLGRHMARALVDDARALGYDIVELHVTDTQKAAIGLYKSMGFVETKRQVFDVEGQSFDTIFMELAVF